MKTRTWVQIAYAIGLASLSFSVHLYGDWRIGGVGVAILFLLLFAPPLSLASIGLALVDAYRKHAPLWTTALLLAVHGAFLIWLVRFLIPAALSV